MKYIFLFILTLSAYNYSIGQNDKVYDLFEVDEPPLLIGQTFKKDANQHQEFKKNIFDFVKKNVSIITGKKTSFEKAFVEIIINKNGDYVISKSSATNKKALKEALKTVKKLPKFSPAKINGEPVKMKFIIPITFNIIVVN